MKKFNVYLFLGLTTLITAQSVSVTASSSLEVYNCRLHDEASYAFIEIETGVATEAVIIAMCDAVMPLDIRKEHFNIGVIGSNGSRNKAGTDTPTNHNPADCIVYDPFF